jgi:hypothetical protein
MPLLYSSSQTGTNLASIESHQSNPTPMQLITTIQTTTRRTQKPSTRIKGNNIPLQVKRSLRAYARGQEIHSLYVTRVKEYYILKNEEGQYLTTYDSHAKTYRY